MKKKGFVGQLSMFDFWNDDVDGNQEVEMVSLVPEEEETQVEEEPKVKKESKEAKEEPKAKKEPKGKEILTVSLEQKEKATPVMHKEELDRNGDIVAEISYLNYNKVYVKLPNEDGATYLFDTAKEAVEFYLRKLKYFTKE